MNRFFSHLLPLLLLAIFFVLPVAQTHAQVVDTTEITAPPPQEGVEDSASRYDDEEDTDEETESGEIIEPVIRNMPADSMRLLKKQTSFAYMVYLDSLLQASQREKQRLPPPPKPQPSSTTDYSPSFWNIGVVKFFCYLVALGMIGFVLFKLFLGPGIFVRNKRHAAQSVKVDVAEEELNESDLEKALRRAISQPDYRLAVRYLFLITLNRLGEKGVLQLSTEKTNYQYATELEGKKYAGQFARLSLQYEYVWFGNFQINATQFKEMEQQHQQFLKEV